MTEMKARFRPPARVHLHVASAGNEFMAHIAEIFAAGFAAIGTPASVVVDGLPLEDTARGAQAIVVAPHEFFPLHFLKRRPTIELEPTLASVAVLNVEQPGSQWFERAWEFAYRARLVLDISAAGEAEFARRGIPAVLAPLGYVPMLESTRAGVAASTRPLDVVFLGSGSPRRNAFFARHARFFASLDAEIRLVSSGRPSGPDTPGYLSGTARSDYLASSKIVLGVHSSDSDYFEQHRALLALANGALLVSEPGTPPDPLVAGTHFVTGSLDDLPAICDHHLKRPETLDAIASAGRTIAREALGIERACRAILDAFTQAAPRPAGTASDEQRRAALRTRIADAAESAARGESVWSSTENDAYRAIAEPDVTVLVTVYNYERFLPQCLASVEAADPLPHGIELLVLDDASSDGSADAAEAFMSSAAVPARVIRKTSNTGLSDTRNLGFRCARSRYVFVLDADNWILPSCLRLLHAALAGSRHAAAYGILARVDDRTGRPTGLESAWPWDPARLVAAPYIDAMALFDRDIVRSVGGYSTDLLEHGIGWEDYDLWLALATAGHSACLVPRIVAMYREHPQSMLAHTRRRSNELALSLRRKYDGLVRQFPPQPTYFSVPSDDALSPEQREMRMLADQIMLLEQEIATIRASASWRATAPIRRVVDWMASLGGRG
jgi:GT2 family glycosyltransferase